MVKCKTGDREVLCSIPGRCSSSVCLFFLFFLFFCSLFFSFFDKKDRKQRNTYVTWQYVIVKDAGSVTLTIVATFPNEFHFVVSLYNHHLSHVMRKPVYAICEQQRCRSSGASAQSDQPLCCCIISLVPISEISSLYLASLWLRRPVWVLHNVIIITFFKKITCLARMPV